MRSDDHLDNIKAYLDDNYCSHITLDDLSNRFYISKYCMIRDFKKRFGKTVLNYVLDKRIEKAKTLLTDTSFSPELIAKKCGFSGVNYFARQFKRREGITSTEYRKKHLQKN